MHIKYISYLLVAEASIVIVQDNRLLDPKIFLQSILSTYSSTKQMAI